MNLPKLLVFASGTKDGGGSGFENLVHWSRANPQSFEVVGVVSNHEHGGVQRRADMLDIPFFFFQGGPDYSIILENYRIMAEWFALSGWLKHVSGLEPARTFNIHPALLSQLGGRFGGEKMYGHRVHEAVAEALERKEITESGLSMHFVTDEYDRGPVFFEYRVPLKKGMTADEIASAVNRAEHEWQPKITNMLVHGEISWDGADFASLKTPAEYRFLPRG
jgi:phosphoribosylglycinamide formyltransferase-1